MWVGPELLTMWFQNHIADNIPAEFEHISFVLEAIRSGKQTRGELNSVLKEYYSRSQKGMQWSNTVVNTMRSGLISRLKELGLVRREKIGKNIRYYITSAGKRCIDDLSSREHVREDYV